MTGLPYSGKTTLSRALEQHGGFELVSVDRIMTEKNMWTEAQPTQGDWNEAYADAYRRIENLLASGRTVIFDCGNLSFRERDNARHIAMRAGVASKLIYLNTPREVIFDRRRVNETTKERGHLGFSLMDDALRMFEEPRESEHAIIYVHHTDLATWLSDNID